jgi:hypothetical protein
MTKNSPCPPRVVRIVLGAFPAAFRTRYGHEIWQCIRDARRDLSDGSFAVTMNFWIGIVADLARGAATEWCRSMSRDYALAFRRAAGLALIGAALANVGYDAMSVKQNMGVFAALLTAVGAIAGALLIRSGPTRSP